MPEETNLDSAFDNLNTHFDIKEQSHAFRDAASFEEKPEEDRVSEEEETFADTMNQFSRLVNSVHNEYFNGVQSEDNGGSNSHHNPIDYEEIPTSENHNNYYTVERNNAKSNIQTMLDYNKMYYQTGSCSELGSEENVSKSHSDKKRTIESKKGDENSIVIICEEELQKIPSFEVQEPKEISYSNSASPNTNKISCELVKNLSQVLLKVDEENEIDENGELKEILSPSNISYDTKSLPKEDKDDIYYGSMFKKLNISGCKSSEQNNLNEFEKNDTEQIKESRPENCSMKKDVPIDKMKVDKIQNIEIYNNITLESFSKKNNDVLKNEKSYEKMIPIEEENLGQCYTFKKLNQNSPHNLPDQKMMSKTQKKKEIPLTNEPKNQNIHQYKMYTRPNEQMYEENPIKMQMPNEHKTIINKISKQKDVNDLINEIGKNAKIISEKLGNYKSEMHNLNMHPKHIETIREQPVNFAKSNVEAIEANSIEEITNRINNYHSELKQKLDFQIESNNSFLKNRVEKPKKSKVIFKIWKRYNYNNKWETNIRIRNKGQTLQELGDGDDNHDSAKKTKIRFSIPEKEIFSLIKNLEIVRKENDKIDLNTESYIKMSESLLKEKIVVKAEDS